MAKTEVLTRSVPAPVTLRSRTLSGYAIRFNELSGNLGGFREIIKPDAWNPVGTPDVVATFNHNNDQILGRTKAGTLRLMRDAQGIRYEIDIPDTSTGRDVAELVRRGDVRGASFTFRVNPGGASTADSPDRETGLPIRIITSMSVFELGPVLNPAYPTTTANARSNNKNEVRTLTTNVSDSMKKQQAVRVFGHSYGDLQSRRGDWFDLNANGDIEAPILLSAAGRGSRLIERVQAFQFSGHHGYVPVTPKITARIQGRRSEQAPIPVPIPIPHVTTVKPSVIVKADNDDLVDIPATAKALESALLAAVGARIDDVIVNGASDEDAKVPGMLEAGTTTQVASLSYDVLVDTVSRVEESGGSADTILGNPATTAAIRKGVEGARLAQLPTLISLPPLADGTAILPTGTAIVADLGSVAVALRDKPEVTLSEHETDAFFTDSTLFRGRARISGVTLADPGRVQILKVKTSG
ncbi:HK97 family phage prohead protease [Streptomyces sp. BPTC-684]|uniref:HK97 family phage prohead protease n=1 Tax=Streptomyces sp. BPTC-684 TaxID=3043734 RepID=UPI0024B09D22|nr:HK97 family phage prohead protease [Streptomyces sp. BPTC-684]WHM37403.1 HK97 family phage prohead protease [Streptomyces sp. BPTC-684]